MDVPAPPEISLPALSFSAPESRRPSAPATPRRGRASAFSQPVSPVTKKPVSPISKARQILAKKPASPTKSPMRRLRKHIHAATFATHNPRRAETNVECPVHSYTSLDAMPSKHPASFPTHNPRVDETHERAACPVHSYVSVEQEIAAMPRGPHAFAGVPFGDAPREVLGAVRPNCPVHVYAEAKSTLSQLGSSSFARHDDRDAAPDVCPVHAYAEPPSSMRQRPATFARHETPRHAPSGSGPAVHAYATPRSMLAAKGAAPFSTDKHGRDSFQHAASRDSLAPVHAYATPRSMLRTSGAVAFGSTAPRGSLTTLSRTGLVPAAVTPRGVGAGTPLLPPRLPRTLRPLPTKLAPISGDRDEIEAIEASGPMPPAPVEVLAASAA